MTEEGAGQVVERRIARAISSAAWSMDEQNGSRNRDSRPGSRTTAMSVDGKRSGPGAERRNAGARVGHHQNRRRVAGRSASDARSKRVQPWAQSWFLALLAQKWNGDYWGSGPMEQAERQRIRAIGRYIQGPSGVVRRNPTNVRFSPD